MCQSCLGTSVEVMLGYHNITFVGLGIRNVTHVHHAQTQAAIARGTVDGDCTLSHEHEYLLGT